MTAAERWAQGVTVHPVSAEAHSAQVLAAGARYGDGPVCVYRTPFFLTETEIRRWRRILPRFHRIIRQVRAALLSDLDREEDSLAARIGVHPQAIRWARIDPGYASVAPLARLDAFCAGGRPAFLELNAESPAGMGYADALASAFRSDPAAQSVDGELRAFDACGALVRTVREVATEWGHRHRRLNLAIVDHTTAATAPEFALIRARFEAAGLVTLIVPPQALTFDGHTLWAGDFAIDVVFRRILVADLRADTHAASALLAAYAARRVCVVSSLRTALLHGKGLFALLHDPIFPLSSTDRAFVRAYIPWTGVLLGTGGAELREHALATPDAWVLKPLDSHGGQGVVLGWAASRKEWTEKLESADAHVLQRRVEEQHADFFDVRAQAPRRRLVDVGPFLARGRLAGFLCRVAEGPLANVTTGSASQVPVFRVG